MIWVALTGAIVLLGLFLVSVVKSYERESARSALDRVEELTESMEQMEIRIRNLETIASSGSKGESPAQAMSNEVLQTDSARPKRTPTRL